MDAYEKILLPNNVVLKRYIDEDAMNPRTEYDNMGVFFHWHRRDHYGDKSMKEAGFESPEDFLAFMKRDGGVFLPVYLYDHSIQRVSTESFMGRAQHAEWDSGQVGFIYATAEKIRECMQVKRISKKTREQVVKNLQSEVETYNMYISNEVYGYVVELLDDDEVRACDGDEDEILELEGEHLLDRRKIPDDGADAARFLTTVKDRLETTKSGGSTTAS